LKSLIGQTKVLSIRTKSRCPPQRRKKGKRTYCTWEEGGERWNVDNKVQSFPVGGTEKGQDLSTRAPLGSYKGERGGGGEPFFFSCEDNRASSWGEKIHWISEREKKVGRRWMKRVFKHQPIKRKKSTRANCPPKKGEKKGGEREFTYRGGGEEDKAHGLSRKSYSTSTREGGT